MKIQEAIDTVIVEGGILYREEWEDGSGLDVEDIVADDWQVCEAEETNELEETVE
jgi:hypothetical protein